MLMMPLVALTDDRKRRLESVFTETFKDAKLTLLQAAQEAEKDVSQFKRILSGAERHLDPLTKQQDRTLSELGLNLVIEFGIPRRARLAAKLRAITIGTKRQLRLTAKKAKTA